MFSKTKLPKLIGLHRRSVRGEWVAQKICPSRIFAFADLSSPMLSGNRHQARGGVCGELTRLDEIAELSPIGLFLVVRVKFEALGCP
jgi:hypothetical protein